MARYVSDSLPVPRHANGVRFARADLEFHGVRHRGPTFEGRVFVNAPDAGLETPKEPAAGYAGSIWIFGHDHCWGDAGHCVPPPGALHGYDARPEHPLVPQIHVLRVTDAVKLLVDAGQRTFTVTVVPVVRDDEGRSSVDDGVLRFERLSLVTYD